MKELKSKIEAVLFCIPEGIDTKKLAKVCGIGSAGHVKTCLKEMQAEFNDQERGVRLMEKDGLWSFAIHDDHVSLVKDAARPEIDKAVLETLAFIAYKKNARQSDIVKFRSNKAYNHINELEEREFITAKRKGKTKVLSPTAKFYNYFKLKEGEELKPEE
jgi:segregation and condensation protein B